MSILQEQADALRPALRLREQKAAVQPESRPCRVSVPNSGLKLCRHSAKLGPVRPGEIQEEFCFYGFNYSQPNPITLQLH
ncbi:hypothetical protein SRHO_G00140610 [Serrasalmus rhombeus]